ncbi:MAG: protein-L-isoaspartate O-methyltransferase [Patescibacteria group bacterium]|nr:protein-L-isoaspartate O-methyltransferase [Patescibacteria group bacterium]
MSLIDNLVQERWLKTPRIIEAFRKIKRMDFLSEDNKNFAEIDEPLPIGYSQTISQPLVVAFMLEKLQPQEGDRILDIGSGSGWTTALLAYCVSSENKPEIQNSKSKTKGKIIAIEVIPELKEFGEKNTAKYNFIKKGIVKFICGDGSKGCEKKAPFDKILASATGEKIPQAWKEQLKVGGRIVAPIKSSIWVLEKKSNRKFEETEYPGFVFVPLVKKNNK